MSRPPEPRASRSPRQSRPGGSDSLDYLSLDYAGLLALQDELAISALGRQPSQAGSSPAEADVTRTMMELSALTGHILAVYQRQYAREGFISTATAPSSLRRHAERLGYQPDPGVAATGHVALFTKPEVSGTISAGLPLASTPLGEIGAKDYETLDDIAVDSALNDLAPAGAMQPVKVNAKDTRILLRGTNLGLGPGDVAIIPPTVSFVIVKITEGSDTTTIEADRSLPALELPSSPISLLARPARVVHPFGSSADPVLFPPAVFGTATGTKPTAGSGTTSGSAYWYTVYRSNGQAHLASDIYLDESLDQILTGQFVARRSGADLTVLKVKAHVTVNVTLNREVTETFPTQIVTVTPKDGGFVTSTTASTGSQLTGGHVSGTVSAIQVTDQAGTTIDRSQNPMPSEWLTGWQTEAALAATQPSKAAVTQPMTLPGLLSGLTPGRALLFRSPDRAAAQVVAVRRAELDPAARVTRIWWDDVSPLPEPGWVWRLGQLRILGNVARISHGRTIDETLGGSDGVSPFQSFQLRQAPLTMLPSATGSTPALQVWVGDVRWAAVTDFAASGPDDRHYRMIASRDGATAVLFGDGEHGAVPPAGRKNITAVYRIGLGRDANAGRERITRIKRSHPLLDRAVNLTPVIGGTDPARPAEIRTVATRWLRTFDRAVSTSDLADLALSIPGIARASARWEQSTGLTLTLATASGESPAALESVRAFLDARRDTSIPLRFGDPQPRDVKVSVLVTADQAFVAEAVKDGVRSALYGEDNLTPGMFTFAARDLGQPAFLSEVYERLEAVPGVIGVQVRRFDSRESLDSGIVADQIPTEPGQWLRLQPNALTLDLVTGGAGA
jgi:predicted phage baseplate assembly protein